jgi:hypothetical protein
VNPFNVRGSLEVMNRPTMKGQGTMKTCKTCGQTILWDDVDECAACVSAPHCPDCGEIIDQPLNPDLSTIDWYETDSQDLFNLVVTGVELDEDGDEVPAHAEACPACYNHAAVCDDCDARFPVHLGYSNSHGDRLCGSCMAELPDCHLCGAKANMEEQFIDKVGDELPICEACLAKADRCADCNNPSDSLTETAYGELVCPNCLDNYILCDGCGEYHRDKGSEMFLYRETDEMLCEHCLDKRVREESMEPCPVCGELNHPAWMNDTDDPELDRVCDDCLDEHFEEDEAGLILPRDRNRLPA